MNTFSWLFALVGETALKAALLLMLAWGACRILKNRSSASRHLIRTCALCAALLLAPLSSLLPAWRVKGVPQLRPEATSAPSQETQTPAATFQPATTRVEVAATTKPRRLREKPAAAAPGAAAAPPQSTWTAAQNNAPATVSEIPNLNWLGILGVAWVFGASIIGIRLLAGRLRLARLVHKASPLGDEGWRLQTQQIAHLLGIRRHVALLESTETEIPITTGTMHPKVILSPDHAEWPDSRRNAVLHHELAHIKRLDSVTQMVADVAMIVYWFHPLVWTTVLAMRAERERACDDQVLATGARPSEYAHELLEIASRLREPALGAALAMARRSQLEGRLMALLNPKLGRGSVSRRVAITIATLTLCVVFPLAAMRAAQQASTPAKPSPSTPAHASTPGAAPRPEGFASTVPSAAPEPARASNGDEMVEPPEPPEPPEPAEAPEPPEAPFMQGVPSAPAAPAAPSAPAAPAAPAAPPAPSGDLDVCGNKAKLHNMSIQSDNGKEHWNAMWSGDDCSVDLRAEGKIEFNAEATDIHSISSGGFFEVNLRQGDVWKQIKVTPSGNGLQYVYKVNGAQQAYDAQAKEWFSSFLLALERSTGFAADSRVRLLLQKGGPNAVLDEINNLHGDYVRGIYFRKLLEQPNLPSSVVVRIINQAGQQIGSDYEMARVLMEVARQYELPDEASRGAFLTAAGKLKSDYEHSRVLIELLKRPNISSQDIGLALRSAQDIKSDYEKSRILLSLLGQKSFDQTYLDFYLKMVASIHSDYEKSRDLIAPMQKYPLSSQQVDQIMDATATIASDYEKSRLLNSLVDKGKFDEKQMSQYLKVLESIHSDYERSRSLMSLMEHNSLSKEAVGRVLDATGRMGSSYEKARVLVAVAQKYTLEGTQRDKYVSIANSLGEYEKNRSLAALVKRASI